MTSFSLPLTPVVDAIGSASAIFSSHPFGSHPQDGDEKVSERGHYGLLAHGELVQATSSSLSPPSPLLLA
jgi:hypothetical protein